MPFAAALAGMNRRKFLLWNAIASVPYALAQVAFGYFLGGVITRLGPMATRMALFALVAAVLLGVLWYLVLRVERTLPFVFSILRSILRAVAENPEVHAWAARHPRLARFIAERLDTRRFGGLSATLLAGIFTYVLFIWAGTVFDFLMADPIVATDQRLARLMHAFWSPPLLGVFAHVTALGDWKIVAVLAAGSLGALALRRQFGLALGLAVALGGDVVSVALLKVIFHRPRPPLAYFIETSGSFPSGHAAISVAFYGMLAYIVWRRNWLGPLSAALLGATVAFAIGLSRIYLIEHYLSDVLNGYLVGTMWLVIGIAVAEWWRQSRPARPHPAPTPLAKVAPAVMIAVALLGVAGLDAAYTKPRNTPLLTTARQTVRDIPALFTSGKAPATTESIAGTPLEPVSLIVIAPNVADFEAAMKSAGWIEAQKPGFRALAEAAWAAITNREDATAPVTPYFWNGLPNELAFQKPTAAKSVRKRHHARFWTTGFVTASGARIFIGSASFDDGIDWSGLHHIDPNIDAERDTLLADLKKAGAVRSLRLFQLSTPHLGQDVAGDPWFTDGKAAIVTLK